MKAASPLFGREPEAASVARLFADGHRIVSLLGPIGVGKTALGTSLAHRVARSLDELSRRSRPDEVVLLDVSEQERAAARKLLRSWNGGRVLVTTRRALGLAHEAVVVVAPLSSNDSVELLMRRARAGGVPVTPAAELTELVELLGGFPLIITRAAKLLRTYDPSRLSERIKADPLRVLFGSRHESVTAAWGASSARLRRVTEALATFAGSWDVAGARAVLVCDEEAAHRALSELLAHSMAHVDSAVGNTRRFALYVPYRWLGRAEAERTGRWLERCIRHARHCVSDASTAGEEWRAIAQRAATYPQSPVWEPGVSAAKQLPPTPQSLQSVELLASLARLPDDIVRLATARAELLRSADRIHDALDVLDAVARHAQDCSPLTEAQRLELAAILLRKARRFEAAVAAAEQAARTYRTLASPRLARALGALGAVLVESGAHDEALERFEEVELLATRAGDDNAAFLAIGYRGHAHQERGELERAVEAYQTASEGLTALGDRRLGAIYLGYGGTALEELGSSQRAEQHYRDAVTTLTALNATAFASLFEACRNALSAQATPMRTPGMDDPGIAAAIELHQLRASFGREPRTHVTPISASIALREVSDDVRFAVRRLAAVRAKTASPASIVLCVGRGSLRLGAGVIDLAPRRVLWRLIEHLIVSHVMAPGRTVPKAELMRAAWGDERMLPQAAAHRLRVAVSELRTKGLGEIIVRTGEGFALGQEVVVSYDGHLMRPPCAAVPEKGP